MLHQGQLDVRIGNRVAVPRKVLAAGRHVPSLERLDDHRPKPGYLRRLVPERAIADHRVSRVRMHIKDRRVVERDANSAQLRCQRPREAFRKAEVAAAPERGHRRPFGER